MDYPHAGQIRTTSEGFEELQLQSFQVAGPSDGEVMATLMEHAEVNSDMGLIWSAVEDYDHLEQHEALRTRYDVQYHCNDDDPGIVSVVAPIDDHDDDVKTARYDLVVVDPADLPETPASRDRDAAEKHGPAHPDPSGEE